MLPYINKEFYYEGYTQLLSEYHTMPVVIAGYGFSTARGIDTLNGRYSEYAQGEKLLSTYNDIVNSGCAGAFIGTWQDTWDRISWNTSYAVDILDNAKWHDVQTMGQSSGILAFKSGKEDIVYTDGDIEEWQDIKPVFKSEDMSLYVQYDAEYIYIMLSGENVSEENIFYLPIDTIQTQGSRTISDIPEVEFEREADFLIYIGGKENSHILVQERYDSLRENYLEKITGEDPFYIYPKKNSNIFVPIRMLLKNDNMALEIMTDEEVQLLSYFEAYETGYLTYGNANPNSEKYNSLADFCYGDKCMEMRIPWAVLNFSNPADMKIHKDYYENYGREDMVISEFYIGAADSSVKNIKMNKVELKGWDKNLDYHQRLKKSYYILQEGWKKR